MSRRCFEDPAIYDQIADQVEAGLTRDRIAEAFGISRGAVDWTALRYGVEAPRSRRRKQHRVAPPYSRGGQPVRPFLPQEDAIITRLAREGYSNAEIGRRLDRPRHSILGRLRVLARREARQEEDA